MRRLPATTLRYCIVILAAAAAACGGGGSDSPTSPTLTTLVASPLATAAMDSGPRAHGPSGPELTALSCSQERSLRSTASAVGTTVEFVNLSGSIKVLYWLSYTGERYRFATMLNGWYYVQPTYVTHPWVVADEAGTCIAIYAPTAEPSTATIREGAAPPPTIAEFNGSWSGTFIGESTGTLEFSIMNSAVTVTQPSPGVGTFSFGGFDGQGEFVTQGPTGECTWTGPFLPGGARQSSASGLWRCGPVSAPLTRGTWSAERSVTPPPTAPPPPPTAPPPTTPPGPTPTPGAGFINATITSATCSNPVPDPVCAIGPGGSCPFINWTLTVTGTASASPSSSFFVSDGVTSLHNISCGGWANSAPSCVRPASGSDESTTWTARQVEEGSSGQSSIFSVTVTGSGYPNVARAILAATTVTCRP
jgi:hypothetical protein